MCKMADIAKITWNSVNKIADASPAKLWAHMISIFFPEMRDEIKN